MRATPHLLMPTLAAALATAALGCDVEMGTQVGSGGGIVTSEDGRITLEIPAGALLDTVPISIEQTDDGPHNATGPTYTVEPYGVTFLRPAHLAYDVSDGVMENPDTARLVTERDDGWEMLGDRNVDIEHGEVTASLLFASPICLVE